VNASELVLRLEKVSKTPSGWQASCPAHDDKTPSLSVTQTGNRVLLHCHAGCTPESICSALGVELSDLFSENGNGHTAKKIVATYDYCDANGELLFQVVRLDPKDFRQRRPDTSSLDGWTWNTKGVQKVLFRLPEITRDIQRGLPVLCCEGEKDVLALAERGFSATCNPGGAGKWQDSFSETLRGADAVIISDKDEPGRAHAALVASKLNGIAKRLRILELPDRNSRTVKDAADYFAAGGTAEDLIPLIDAAPDWAPQANSWAALVEDAAAIVEKTLPEPVEIVSGLVTGQSKLVIGSGSKSFKTWLTMHLSLCVSHGLPIWDRATTRQPVLYVNLELKPVTFERRLKSIAAALNLKIEPEWFRHLPLRGKLAGMTVDKIITRIIGLAGQFKSGVIVLDPIFKMNLEGEENNSRDQTLFFNQIDRLTTESGCTVILNDHFGKGNQSEKDPLDAIRGSSAKGGDVDAAMILRKHEEENAFRVDVIHRELPPVEPFTISWKFPLMELRPDLSPDAMKAPKSKTRRAPPEKVAEVCQLAMTKADLARALIVRFNFSSRQSAYDAIVSAEAAGKIKWNAKAEHFNPA
jgi:hypothetical protein